MNGRSAVAFVIAPGIVPATLYLRAQWTLSSVAFERVQITYSLMFVVTYTLAVVVGMPMFRFMQTHEYRLLRHYILAGSLIGGIPGLALFLRALPTASPGIVVPTLIGSLIGAFSAAAFWLIGICNFTKRGT